MQNQARTYLVSPPLACGVAWPWNALMELDIPVIHWNTRNDWTVADGLHTPVGTAHDAMLWHLPVLQRKTSFRFRAGAPIYFEHRLDFLKAPIERAVLFLRDPRDATFSIHHRNYKEVVPDYHAFLHALFPWNHHMPGLFQLPPPETFLMFVLTWRLVRTRVPLLTLTFEEMRARPLDEFRRILDFYGHTASDADIAEALANSSVQKAKENVDRVAQTGAPLHSTVRKGKVDEWKETHSAAALARWAEVLPVYDIVRGLEADGAGWTLEALSAWSDPFGIMEQVGDGFVDIVGAFTQWQRIAGVSRGPLGDAAKAFVAAVYWALLVLGPEPTGPIPLRLLIAAYLRMVLENPGMTGFRLLLDSEVMQDMIGLVFAIIVAPERLSTG